MSPDGALYRSDVLAGADLRRKLRLKKKCFLHLQGSDPSPLALLAATCSKIGTPLNNATSSGDKSTTTTPRKSEKLNLKQDPDEGDGNGACRSSATSTTTTTTTMTTPTTLTTTAASVAVTNVITTGGGVESGNGGNETCRVVAEINAAHAQQQSNEMPQFQSLTVDGQEAIFIPISAQPPGKSCFTIPPYCYRGNVHIYIHTQTYTLMSNVYLVYLR